MAAVHKRLNLLERYWGAIKGIYRFVANKYKSFASVQPIEDQAKYFEAIPPANIKQILANLLKTASLEFFEKVKTFFIQKHMQFSNVQKRLYTNKLSERNYDNDISEQLKHLQRTLIRKATTKKSLFPIKKPIEEPVPTINTSDEPILQLIIPYPEMEALMRFKNK
jgi:hypothetical protein